MTEIVIIALLVFIAVQEYFTRKERKRFMDAFMAKNLEELKVAERIEKTPPAKEEIEKPPDLVETENASEEMFELAIKKELGREPFIEKAKEKLKGAFKNA